jgi:biopolymer transport protein ExbD/biopolymer transport protein TolR
MGMTAGGGGGKHAEPEVNVTPLVDVALVVLIIFMVVAPMTVKTFWLNLPKKEDPDAPPPENVDEANKPLVMTIARDGVIRVNKTVVEKQELAERLPRMLAAKPENRRILYFDAHDEVPYGTAVEVMDLSRAAGARSIAILTSKVAGD